MKKELQSQLQQQQPQLQQDQLQQDQLLLQHPYMSLYEPVLQPQVNYFSPPSSPSPLPLPLTVSSSSPSRQRQRQRPDDIFSFAVAEQPQPSWQSQSRIDTATATATAATTTSTTATNIYRADNTKRQKVNDHIENKNGIAENNTIQSVVHKCKQEQEHEHEHEHEAEDMNTTTNDLTATDHIHIDSNNIFDADDDDDDDVNDYASFDSSDDEAIKLAAKKSNKRKSRPRSTRTAAATAAATATATVTARIRRICEESNEGCSDSVSSSSSSNNATIRWINATVVVSKHDLRWNEMYQLLVAYKKEHSHTNIPRSYKENPQLGSWIDTQRRNYRDKKITEERKCVLNSIDFGWDVFALTWEEMYGRLVAYKSEHKHTKVPTKDKEDPELGQWVSTQRRAYRKKKMPEERKLLLDSIGFDWNVKSPGTSSATWKEMYQQLVAYKKEHNNTKVLRRYKKSPQLGTWVDTQRTAYKRKKMTEERKSLLDSIGFV